MQHRRQPCREFFWGKRLAIQLPPVDPAVLPHQPLPDPVFFRLPPRPGFRIGLHHILPHHAQHRTGQPHPLRPRHRHRPPRPLHPHHPLPGSQPHHGMVPPPHPRSQQPLVQIPHHRQGHRSIVQHHIPGRRIRGQIQLQPRRLRGGPVHRHLRHRFPARTPVTGHPLPRLIQPPPAPVLVPPLQLPQLLLRHHPSHSVLDLIPTRPRRTPAIDVLAERLPLLIR